MLSVDYASFESAVSSRFFACLGSLLLVIDLLMLDFLLSLQRKPLFFNVRSTFEVLGNIEKSVKIHGYHDVGGAKGPG